MKVVILAGTREMVNSLRRYLDYSLSIKGLIYGKYLGDAGNISHELLQSDLWICEAFNPEDVENPEGWRTAKILPEKTKRLVFFLPPLPLDFPSEGVFWLTLPYHLPILKKKILEVLNSPFPLQKEFDKMEKVWPLLKRKPGGHHHG